MSNEVLAWKEALERVMHNRELYVKLLRKFMETERDCVGKVELALNKGDATAAREEVHRIKGTAANLGAKALAAAALELEMAIKAGADTTVGLKHFDSALTDTLVNMAGFISQ